eukprot:scaffold99841_cov21-Tisochrysis_lutea.AAC.3
MAATSYGAMTCATMVLMPPKNPSQGLGSDHRPYPHCECFSSRCGVAVAAFGAMKQDNMAWQLLPPSVLPGMHRTSPDSAVKEHGQAIAVAILRGSRHEPQNIA